MPPILLKNEQSVQLILVSLFSILLYLLYSATEQRVPRPEIDRMQEAADRVHLAYQILADHRTQGGLSINALTDPNLTGLIGIEYSPITTTLGNLEAKHTALNPDWAALLVAWLAQLNLQPGDRVAVQLSGSFPGLNIATLIACEALELEPVISSSAGASSYGANEPAFTWLDIENLLMEQGVIRHRSGLVTPGGINDGGNFLWEGGNDLVRQTAERNQYTLQFFNSLEESVAAKKRFFGDGGKVRVFMNVGGNHTALGNCIHSSGYQTGMVKMDIGCGHPERGLLAYFAENQVPVIHLLDIRSLAIKYHLPVAPHPFPPPGQSDLYFTIHRSKPLAILSLLLLTGFWIIPAILLKQSFFF